nr:uncharacterized protein LOC113830476 [Penaeus vannamei]
MEVNEDEPTSATDSFWGKWRKNVGERIRIRSICARGLILPIDEEPRPVAVWTEKGDGVRVDGPGIFKYVRQRSEAKWLNFTAVQRGSEFCVSSETFPGELCEKNRDRLDLWTGSETKWNVEPANITSGCNQYSLLYLALDLHDSPTKLLWRPGERAESLRLGLWRTGSRKNVFIVPRKTDSQLQYDMTFQRVSDDASCAVTSASINVSRICLKDQKEIIYISIASLDDNGSETPSYFSFNCEDGAGWQTGATASSPDDNSTEDSTSGTSWYSSVFVRFVFGIALVAMGRSWVAKTYQGNLIRPPAPVL